MTRAILGYLTRLISRLDYGLLETCLGLGGRICHTGARACFKNPSRVRLLQPIRTPKHCEIPSTGSSRFYSTRFPKPILEATISKPLGSELISRLEIIGPVLFMNSSLSDYNSTSYLPGKQSTNFLNEGYKRAHGRSGSTDYSRSRVMPKVTSVHRHALPRLHHHSPRPSCPLSFELF